MSFHRPNIQYTFSSLCKGQHPRINRYGWAQFCLKTSFWFLDFAWSWDHLQVSLAFRCNVGKKIFVWTEAQSFWQDRSQSMLRPGQQINSFPSKEEPLVHTFQVSLTSNTSHSIPLNKHQPKHCGKLRVLFLFYKSAGDIWGLGVRRGVL